MRAVSFIVLAIASLLLSIICFGSLLVSCAGHLPATAIGFWILPVSLLGATIFLYLTLFFWKASRRYTAGSIKTEAKSLPKKIAIFLVAFLVAGVFYFLLTGVMVFLAVKTTMPDWGGYAIQALFVGLAVYSGFITYKRLMKKNV